MFINAVCFMFLIKLRWPKTKSLYDTNRNALLILGIPQNWLGKGGISNLDFRTT